jgi:diguanylate cyclase (GGDEF)-like protein
MADIQSSILDLCIELDSLATQVYHRFSEVERDESIKARWRMLEADEATHIRFWRILIEAQENGVIPEMFDDPLSAYRSFENARYKIHEYLSGMGDVSDTQMMLTIACHVEVEFLDQALLQLLKYIKTVWDGMDPFEQYHDHLERFLDLVNTYGESAELKLVGETIARLWTDNRKLLDSSFMDPLTGLRNRRGFFQTVIPLTNLARRKGSTVAVFMIDIDHFKRVNDSHGHKAGDDVLRIVADAVKGSVRGSDVPARYGGEEFVVFLSEVDPSSLPSIGEKLRRGVEETSAAEIPVTVSVGISHGTVIQDGKTESWLDTMIRKADANLYRAKETGRNRVVVQE